MNLEINVYVNSVYMECTRKAGWRKKKERIKRTKGRDGRVADKDSRAGRERDYTDGGVWVMVSDR